MHFDLSCSPQANLTESKQVSILRFEDRFAVYNEAELSVYVLRGKLSQKQAPTRVSLHARQHISWESFRLPPVWSVQKLQVQFDKHSCSGGTAFIMSYDTNLCSAMVLLADGVWLLACWKLFHRSANICKYFSVLGSYELELLPTHLNPSICSHN